MPGAEKLLGSGDMLYLGGEMSKPQRIQSAFISENEVKKVVKYLVDNFETLLSDEISFEKTETGNNPIFSTSFDDETGGSDDELYEQAREIVIQSGKASSSYLQRRLKVGYARAARLLDMLEERGVVGPGEGAKPREVLVSSANETGEGDLPETNVAQ
jgi:S-DNA-T family DNA segregation ATPase FtsK/SpoIIIE